MKLIMLSSAIIINTVTWFETFFSAESGSLQVLRSIVGKQPVGGQMTHKVCLIVL